LELGHGPGRWEPTAKQADTKDQLPPVSFGSNVNDSNHVLLGLGKSWRMAEGGKSSVIG
jgi:hypothetical protein